MVRVIDEETDKVSWVPLFDDAGKHSIPRSWLSSMPSSASGWSG